VIRALALAALLALAACKRGQADMGGSADAEAQRNTAQATLDDLAAAEEAARAPLPPQVERPTSTRERKPRPAPEADLPADEPVNLTQ
jgi:hypothetical protein